jgi:hypothetical protein
MRAEYMDAGEMRNLAATGFRLVGVDDAAPPITASARVSACTTNLAFVCLDT